MDRRHFLSGLALALAGATSSRARGAPVWRPLPPGLDPRDVPGLSWTGSGPAAIEVFDYNCPYCRAAFKTLDRRAETPGALRLGLIDSPQLSIGSIEAAKIHQAILLVYGQAKAYAFHRMLFAHHGQVDGEVALSAARRLGLDIDKLTKVANGDRVRDNLIIAARFLDKAGARVTPSFFVRGKVMSGWPGAAALDAALKGGP